MGKSNIPEKLIEILKEIGETSDSATWDCHGTRVVLHKALEKVAAYKDIAFDRPDVLECNSKDKVVALVVRGFMDIGGDKIKSEWSIGEAAPSNNKNSYPYAMAEKRAKDRVILKLAGLHGDVYSEDEADAFQEGKPMRTSADPEPQATPLPKQQEGKLSYTPRELGRMVREARGNTGQKTFAEAAGLTVSELAKVEGGQACLSFEQVLHLSAKTKIPSDTLLGVRKQ